MLNLRQLNGMDNTETNSDVQYFSQFSVEFRTPSNLLGNIGEPLDHSQSERIHEGELGEREAVAGGSEASAGADLEGAGLAAGPFGSRLEDEDRASVGTVGAAAGSSLLRWDDNVRASLDNVIPGTETSGTRGDEVSDASYAPGYVDGADPGEEVRLCLCLCRCSSKLKPFSSVGTGDQR